VPGCGTAERCGHFPQISTAPDFQGIGLGWLLVETALLHLAASGFLSVSLAVTVLNENAVRPYEKLGFRKDLTFSTFVKDVRR
jgi:ribosomal protein S18 acetylase RimI-like enzyme